MAALTAEAVPGLVAGGASARVPGSDLAAKFAVGDKVIMKNINPKTHTRLARYVRGKEGVVNRHHGVFHFNDVVAHHGEGHQNCYSVKFTMLELWGEGYSATDYVYIDMFDDYMEKIS
ncbi:MULTISPECIES: SH3-like domain-containing protein [Roseobacteraceae]|uniref:SH3-like domain-containing protein n=1 Tax=Roseobacteraceae TaxID=2854170 RepID=UPI00329A7CD9